MAELGRRFADRAPAQKLAIEAAIRQNDRESLVGLAHKLAGIAPMFGHRSLGDAAAALEDAARDGRDFDLECRRLLELLEAI